MVIPPSMSFSTTSIPISPRTTAGSSEIPTCISTSPRRAPHGSTKWKFGSRSWKENPCTVPPSTLSPNFASTSMHSSKPTTKTPNRLSGPKPRSISAALKAAVSANCDSGYYSRSRSWWFIASMSEIAHTFRGTERPNIRPDTSLQSVDCALRSFAQQCLERVENQLYGVKVRRILRQVAETCTSSADHLRRTSDLVEGHVIDHHDVPTLEGWDQTLLYVRQECVAIHGPLTQHRSP